MSSDLMSASRLTCTAGSSALFCRSKISASDPLASTKTPRTDIPFVFKIRFRSRRHACERQHRVHQNVGAGGAIGLRGVFQFIVADAVLARYEDHGGRNLRIEIAGVVAGAGRNAAMGEAELP